MEAITVQPMSGIRAAIDRADSAAKNVMKLQAKLDEANRELAAAYHDLFSNQPDGFALPVLETTAGIEA